MKVDVNRDYIVSGYLLAYVWNVAVHLAAGNKLSATHKFFGQDSLAVGDHLQRLCSSAEVYPENHSLIPDFSLADANKALASLAGLLQVIENPTPWAKAGRELVAGHNDKGDDNRVVFAINGAQLTLGDLRKAAKFTMLHGQPQPAPA